MQERRSLFLNNVYLLTVVFFLVTVSLIYTRSILVPFTISVLITIALSPVTYWCQTNLRMKPVLSVLLTLVVFLVLASGLVVLVSNSFEHFFQSAGIYRERLLGFIQWWDGLAGRLGLEVNAASVQNELRQLPILQMTQNLTGGLLSFLGNAVLIVIFVLFLMMGERGQHHSQLVREIQLKISLYLGTKVVMSLLTSLLVWGILLAFGVELASTFAILTLLLNFIPTIGSIVATLLPLPILLLQYGPGPELAVVLALSITVQFVIGSVLEPKILGENLDIHPIAILLFLMFWGLVWGIPGMFMAVPLTAIKKIVFSRIDVTRPLAEALAGRLG